MLLPLRLEREQLIIASVVLTMHFPCIATFVVFLKEFGPMKLGMAVIIMVSSVLLVGGVLHALL